MEEGTPISYNNIWLGTPIVKFDLPMKFIDKINKLYDENSKNLPPMNNELAGKIAEEKSTNEIMTADLMDVFDQCFNTYLKITDNIGWATTLSKVWINEMRAGEYNPTHFHKSSISEVGLSSVLMLKRPDSYGVEASRSNDPTNGWLEFMGGDQSTLSKCHSSVDAQVGEFYIFPYTLLHSVNPFNGTDEVRRTLSYNCDLRRTYRNIF